LVLQTDLLPASFHTNGHDVDKLQAKADPQPASGLPTDLLPMADNMELSVHMDGQEAVDNQQALPDPPPALVLMADLPPASVNVELSAVYRPADQLPVLVLQTDLPPASFHTDGQEAVDKLQAQADPSPASGLPTSVHIDGQETVDNLQALADQPPALVFGDSGNMVVRLTRSVPNSVGHKVYFGNYFSSPELMSSLAQRGINCLGTVRSNRLPNCALMSDSVLKKKGQGAHAEIVTIVDEKQLSVVRWYDNRTVTFLSTFVGAQPVSQITRYSRVTQ